MFISLCCLLLGFKHDRTLTALEYKGKVYRCVYHRNQGRLDGLYTSYYNNGRKRAEGYFDNNQRSGRWSVWDSTGKLRVRRIYTDPFNFEQQVPELPQTKLSRLMHVPAYTPARNQDGYIAYFDLQERLCADVRWFYKWISPDDNPLLFESLIFEKLCEGIRNKSIEAYAKPWNVTTHTPIALPDTASMRLIGFKLHLQWTFDHERLIAQYWAIDLCPVVVSGYDSDTIDLFWVRIGMDISRKYLSEIHVQGIQKPEKIKSMDDLLFYQHLYGTIHEEESDSTIIVDNLRYSYRTPIPPHERHKKTEQVEIDLIEYEHDLWDSHTGGKK